MKKIYLLVGMLAALCWPATAQSPAGSQQTPPVTTVDQPAFAGHIGLNAAQSTPAWPAPVKAPAGAPNVLLIMTDDVGFAVRSTFGGPVQTPNLERLAASGIRYNEFHTTAMCSPSRAALLTGRNHHAVSTGIIVDLATGYPGYWATIPKSAATVAEILKDNGYNTAMFGKHHNVPTWESSAAGPFDHWPTGLGFEYFYGFIIGDTNQWHPILYRNTLPAPDNATRDSGVTLDHELADDAIHWIHQQKAAAPDKPFFLYFAPGSGHAPHQAPADWIAKFKGKFDSGWDVLREQTFERQKKLGIIPKDAALTPRPASLPSWDSVSPEQKRIDARYMEVFAGMLAYQDAQIGRIFDEIERMGLKDNTLVIFVEGDNGAEGGGGFNGNLNEVGKSNGFRMTQAEALAAMDDMGGPHSYELYPSGWAWALDTPFQWVKTIASHLGGMRNGLIVSWPAKIKKVGQIRSQFTHITDITPTILEAVGVTAPKVVNGVPQQPMDGTSLAYTFDHPDAPARHTTQYFEMLGNRGIYQDGWLANTTPKRIPWLNSPATADPFNEYQWELYDLRHDYSQSRDLAAQYPDKLKAMQALWLSEAKRNNVLPLDDRTGAVRFQESIAAHDTHSSPDYVYWGKNLIISEDAAPSFPGRSFSIVADLTVPTENTTGVILARGSWFGGWSFYLKDGKPVAYEAFTQKQKDQFKIEAPTPLKPGPATIRYDFVYDGGGLGKGGTMHISVDGKEVASGRIDRTIIVTAGQGETFDIGLDTGAPVSEDYSALGRFAGDIRKIAIHLGPRAQGVSDEAGKIKASSDVRNE